MSARFLLRLHLLFVLAMAGANLLVHALKSRLDFPAPKYWPMSIFEPRLPTPGQLLPAAGALLLFIVLWRKRWWRRPVAAIAVAGLLLVALSSLGQGWHGAFVQPVAGAAGNMGGIQYWHDALELPGFVTAFCEFESIQPGLEMHSGSHPPGAVLIVYALQKAFGTPGGVGLALFLISGLLAALLLPRLFRLLGAPELAGYGLAAFFLLPAAQIYLAVSMDALVAGLFLGVVVFYLEPGRRAWLLALLFLALAFLVTFAALFLPPLLLWWEWRRRRSLRRSLSLLAALGLLLLLARFGAGMDYLQVLLIASSRENPEGFRLLSEPMTYLVSRFENVAEILLFLGPLLSLYLWRGLRRGAGAAAGLARAAVAILVALFIAGAFHNGETARGCLFAIPLLLPAALREAPEHERERVLLPLLFVQGLLMQLFGSFFW